MNQFLKKEVSHSANWLPRKPGAPCFVARARSRAVMLPLRSIVALLVLFACAAALDVSRAAVLAYEGFNYAAGSGNLTGQTGGFGWNGPWQGVNNGPSSVQSGNSVAGANAPSGYDALSSGNSALTPNNTRTGRLLDTSVGGNFGSKGYLNGTTIGASGKTVYISFMQQPNGTTAYYEFEFHRGNLGDPGRFGGIGNDSGNSTSVYLRVPAASQTAIGAGSTSVNFYVVRIDFLGGNDTVYVYQNPTSSTEPGAPTLLMTGAGDMSFDGLSMGAFNNGRTVVHDEIRVGETWSDVISGSPTYGTGNWNGNGTDANWSTAANWVGGAVPSFATSLTFAGNNGLNNTNDFVGVSANGITFDAAAGAFVLNGNSLGLGTASTIGFNGVPASPRTQMINLPLTPSGNVQVNVCTNGDITLNGNVTGANTEVTQGSVGNVGVMTLGGTNALKGLVINNGTNRITGATSINGIGGSSFFYLADGQTTRTATMIIEPGAMLNVSGGFQDAAVIGRDGGIGTIIQNGGTFDFNINDGSHEFLFLGASGNPNTRAVYNMNGGLLDMNGKTLGVALGANTVITGIVNQVGGVITNVGNLYFSPFFAQGHGIYNLTGGSLYVGAGGITAFGGSIYEINLGGGTVGAVASWTSSLNMTLTGSNGPVTFNPGGNTIALSGVLSGSGGLTVAGAGTLELSGANTYTGDTTISAGSTLQLDSTGSSAGAFRLDDGAVLNLNFSGNFAIGSLYTNGVALPIGTYNSSDLPGFIVGSGNVQVVSGISTGHWTGQGADNNWSTAGNWDNNAVPVFPHTLTFEGNTQLTNNNDLSGITISSLTFDATAGAFRLGGNDVNMAGPIGFNGTPSAPVVHTIDFGISWVANQSVNLNLPTNGSLTFNGNFTSSTNLMQTGGGTLVLAGTDSFNAYTINGGTNVITGNVTINGNGGTVFLGDASTNFYGTLIIQPGATLTISGTFGDALVVGRDSGSGRIIQNGGTFSYSNPGHPFLFIGATSRAGTRAEYDMNGGTLDLNGQTLAPALGDGGIAYDGILNQTGGAILNVSKLDLGAVRNYGRGVYNLSGGSIAIDFGGITSDSGSYAINLGGGTISAIFSWISSLNMTLTGSNGPVTFDTAGNTIALSGILSGPGGLNVTGGGILELSGANSYLGDTTVSSGILQLDTTGSSAGAIRVVDGGMLNLNYSGDFAVAALYTNGVAVPDGTYNSANLPSYITGSGNLQVVGAISTGLWTGLGVDNNWSSSGNWDNNAVPVFPHALTFAGNTRLNNNNDLTSITVSGLTFDSAASAFTLNGNDVTLSGSIGFNGTPAVTVTQTVNLGMTWIANQTISLPANAAVTLGGNISASAYKLTQLSPVNAGLLTLGGNNALAGFVINGGTNCITGTTTVVGTGGGSQFYLANASSAFQSTLVIENGADLEVNGSFADALVIGRDGGVGTVTQNGGLFNFNINDGSHEFIFVGASGNPNTHATYNMNGGVLNMNGKTFGVALGANTVITGAVNQVGGVITNVGQLYFSPFFAQGHGIYNLTGGSLYIGSGGIINYAGSSYEIYLGGGTVGATANWASSLDMTLTGANGAVQFDPAGNTITLSGVLFGPGGLTVNGSGVLELAGVNTFTGDTTVNAGTLTLDSTSNHSGTFRIINGATLNLNYGGTMTVTNFYTNGVALPPGTYNASNLPGFITGSGAVQVPGGLPTEPPIIDFNISNGQITISWPANYQGWILQQQTNSTSVGLGTNWMDVAGSAGVTSTNIAIDSAIPTAFYRLRYPTP